SYQKTDHYMNKILSERSGDMPMNTKSIEKSFKLKVTKDINSSNILSAGFDMNLFNLDDWWSPVSGSMMMSPNIYQSINDGKRNRFALYIENETFWTRKLSSIVGLRGELVKMETGNVTGYNSTNNLPADAGDFNSKDKKKSDENIDATAVSKYQYNDNLDLELGIARKNRSPNMYERYAWAGSVTDPASSGPTRMDMRMINWFGDGNGYVGNLALKPETAHTISASAKMHDQS